MSDPAEKTAEKSTFFTVSKAAKELGISTSTLRRLETEGFITSKRDQKNARFYSEEAVSNLKDSLSKKRKIKEEIKIKKKAFRAGVVPQAYNPIFIPASAKPKIRPKLTYVNALVKTKWTVVGVIITSLILAGFGGYALRIKSSSDPTAGKVKGGGPVATYEPEKSVGLLLPTALRLTNTELEVFAETKFWQDVEARKKLTLEDLLVRNNVTIEDSLKVGNDIIAGNDITARGGLTVDENTIIGRDTSKTLKINARVTSDIIPYTTNTYSLGSSELQFKNIYASGTAYIGTLQVTNGQSISGQVLLSDGTALLPALAFTNDTNTGLYRISDDKIGLITGGSATQGITLDSGGNVGIGTTNPRASLHIFATNGLIIPVGTTLQRPGTPITGTIRYNNATSQFEGYSASSWGSLGGLIDVDQDTYISAENSAGADNDQLRFFTAGGERFFIGADGNIGIGTTVPATTFDVVGTLRASGVSWLGSGLSGHGLYVNSSGSVGIGTTSPGVKLDVDTGWIQASNQYGLSLKDTSGTGRIAIKVDNLNNLQLGDNNTLNALTFLPGASEKMRITSTGNVGIGTTNPGAKLHVEGQCVTGDSELITEDGKVLRVDQVKGGEKVYSLDETTGKFVPAKITALMDMGVKPTFRLTTEDGKSIETTGNHPYLTKDGWKEVIYLAEGEEIAVAKSDLAVTKNDLLFGFGAQSGISNNGNSQQKQSNDNIESLQPVKIHSLTPFNNNKLITKQVTVAANPNDIINKFTLSTPVNNGTTAEAKTTKPRLAVNSDNLSNWELFSSSNITSYGNSKNSDMSSDIAWTKIASIKYVGEKQVWDLSIEGTHNFVANGIVAHNTYISGNVGIGTTNPSQKLEIAGKVTMDDDLGAYEIWGTNTNDIRTRLDSVAGVTYLDAVNSGAVHIQSGSVSKLVILNNGNVGIGTTSPGWLLEISKANATTGIDATANRFVNITNTDITNNNIALLGFSSKDSDGTALRKGPFIGAVFHDRTATVAPGDLIFGASTADSLAERMRITSAGNVGIGTTAPTTKLSVVTSVNNSATTINTDTSGLDVMNSGATAGGYALFRLGSWSGGTLATTDGNYIQSIGNANNDVDLAIGRFESSNIINEFVRIKNSGNVGIGTISPAGLLQVGSSATASFVVTSAGQVGIGTTSPTQKLDVVGSANLSSGNAYYINGSSVLNNNTLGTGVFTSSLTTVGILGSGSIASGFGAIDTGADNIITTGTMGVAANTVFTGLSQTLTGQFASSYANTAALNLTGNGAGITFTGTGVDQIITAASQHLALMPGGNVGIGTTNPLEKLHITGGDINVDTSYGYRINNTATSGNYLRGDGTRFVSSAIQLGDLPTISAAGGWTDGGTSVYLTTTSDNVGIGTSSPLNKLDISGSVAIGSLPANALTQSNMLYVSGNVGIGTTNPLSKLTVAGSIFPSVTSSYDLGSASYVWNNLYANNIIGTGIQGYWTGYGTNIANNNAGNVGIGTTGPTAKTHINVASDVTNVVGLEIGRTATGTLGTPRTIDLAFSEGPNKGYIGGISAQRDASTSNWNSQLLFYTSNDITGAATTVQGLNERMRIDSSGNVGIGAIPGQRLTVDGTSGSPATSGTTQNGIFRVGTIGSGRGTVLDIGKYHDSPYGMWMQITNSTDLSASYPLILQPNAGNVGIGTTAPAGLLAVGASSQFTVDSSGDIIKLKNLTYSWPSAHTTNGVLTNNGTGGLTWATIGASGITADSLDFTEFKDAMTLDASTNVAMAGYNYTFSGSGNVGIGTTAPLDKFVVYGSGVKPIIGDSAVHTEMWIGYNTLTTSSALEIYSNGGTFTGLNIVNNKTDTNGVIGSIYFANKGGGTEGASDLRIAAIVTQLDGTDNNSGVLAFHTTNAGTLGERMRIDKSGNVGIGTTNPGAKLHIEETTDGILRTRIVNPSTGINARARLQLTNDVSSAEFGLFGSNYTTANWKSKAGIIAGTALNGIVLSTADSIQFDNDAAATKVFFDMVSGNVGIGTTGPDQPLHVKADSDYIAKIQRNSSTDNALALLGFSVSGTDTFEGGYIGGLRRAGDTGGLDLVFGAQTGGNAATEKMRITGSGNVGIGTTGPGYKLDVAGDLRSTTGAYFATTSGNVGIGIATPVAGLHINKNSNTIPGLKLGNATYGWEFYERTDNGDLQIKRQEAGTSYDVMYMNRSTGNVGIGTTGPSLKLEVAGTNGAPATSGTAQNGALRINNNSSNGNVLDFGTYDSAPFGMWMQVANRTDLSSTYPLVLNPNGGNVGIGTTAPSSKLHIQGTNVVDTPKGDIIMARYWASISDTRASSIFHYYNSTTANDTLAFGVAGLGGTDGQPNQLSQIKMVIQASGNVGIGTTGPGALLDVSSASGGAGTGIRLIQAAENGTVASSYVPIDFTVPTTGLIGQFLASANNYSSTLVNLPSNSIALLARATAGTLLLGAGGASGDIRFNTGGYAVANERMRINSTGNVGIGTTAPVNKLDVFGSMAIGSYAGVNTAPANGLIISGNVGIGTTSPGALLDVNGLSIIRNYMQLNSGTTRYGYIGGTNLFTGISALGIRADGALYFGTNGDGNNPRIVIDTSGNVGIGTTAPGYKLDVNGVSRSTNHYLVAGAGNGIGFWSGAPSTYGIFMSSSATYQYGDVTDYYIANVMSSGTGRGFTWSYGAVPSMALNANSGNLEIKGVFTANGAGNNYFAGNVGIGTTAPTALLETYTTANTYASLVKIAGRVGANDGYGLLVTPQLQIPTTAVTDIGGLKVAPIIFDNIVGIDATNYRGIYIPVPTGAGHVVNAYGLYVESPTHGSTINAAAIFSGNVGIGTTGPGELLELYGAGKNLTINAPATGNEALGFKEAGTWKGYIQWIGTSSGVAGRSGNFEIVGPGGTGKLSLWNGVRAVDIDSSGNVGIGTTSPQALLSLGITTGDKFLVYDSGNVTTSYGLGVASGRMYIRTSGNSEAVSFTSTGNVGIGTTNPGTKLAIAGTAIANGITLGADQTRPVKVYHGDIDASGTTGTLISDAARLSFTNAAYLDLKADTYVGPNLYFNGNDVFISGQSLGFWSSDNTGTGSLIKNPTASSSVLGFFISNSEKMRVDSSGNVGIGTTAPSSLLEVNKTQNAETALKVRNLYTGAGGVVKLSVGYNDAASLDIFRNYGDADFYFNTTQSGADYRFQNAGGDLVTILGSGNVGIGTTNPARKFEVRAGTNMKGAIGTGIDVAGAVTFEAYNDAADTNVPMEFRATKYDFTLGNVGIGTTAPGYKLEVSGTTYHGGTTYFGGVGTLTWGGTPSAFRVYGEATRPLSLGSNGVVDRLYMDTSGNVGIGTTNPLSKLSVAGLGSSTGTALVIDANGNIYKDSSSIRFKENLVPLESDFSKILTLTPYSFNFKETGASDIGYMAEDVAAAGLLDLVLYDSEGNPSSIKYNRMPLYAFEILKSQQLKLTALEDKLSKLGIDSSQILDTSNLEIDTSFPSENLTISEGSAENSETSEILTEPTREIESLKTRLDTVELALGIGGTSSLGSDPLGSDPQKGTESFLTQLKEIITLSADNIAIDKNLVLYKDLNVLGKTTVDELAVTGKFTVGLLVVDGLESSCENANSTSLGSDPLGSDPLKPCDPAGASIKTLAGDLSLQGLVKITKEGNVVLEKGVIAGNSSFRDSIIIPNGKDTIYVKRGIPCPAENTEDKTGVSPNGDTPDLSINGMCVSDESAKWTTLPVTVNTTPDYDTNVWVENITTEGFTIKLGTASQTEQKVYWLAVW